MTKGGKGRWTEYETERKERWEDRASENGWREKRARERETMERERDYEKGRNGK